MKYITQNPEPVNVKLKDISGQLLASYTVTDVHEGINNFEVVSSEFVSGMYFIEVSNSQKTLYTKFVKQ